ncbi:MAG: glycosyltransferase [Flavobacteriaceae bacterium]|jgi:ADP-heptose:LPS heptosyltransferase/glycosyltransferase involved in cell wall biosynthesis|nr:glycosyltransferase [Flavobacteriaceae bacterium]
MLEYQNNTKSDFKNSGKPKALILQNKYIGDVLTSSVIAENLKQINPEMEVHFFCYKPAVSVLENNPYIDQIISFDEKNLKKLSVLNQYANQIKQENYDIVLDPYAKLQSRFITLKSRAKRRISYDKPFFKHIYTDVVEKVNIPSPETSCTAIDNRVSLVTPLLDKPKNMALHPKIYLTEEEIREGKEILENANLDFSRKTLMIGILGSGEDKSWPIEYMIQLISHIQKYYNFNLLFNYIPSQQPTVDKILAGLKTTEKIYPEVMGKNVREFLKILTHCDALVGNEGGAVNMAKALDVPTFSIYSPHKFPADWGCFEDGHKHLSVHFQDLDKRTVDKVTVKELIKNTQKYYKKLNYSYVRAETDKFLQDNFGKVDLPNGFEEELPKISALLITYNEERNIQKFLDEAWYADEIIIVDSESTDRTAEIAKKHPKVTFITRKFDNFTSQKNFAIDQAQNEWVTFFDADERIPKSLIFEMIDEIKKDEADAFFVYRRFYFMEKYIKRSGWQNDKAIRLFRKSKNRYGEGRLVHELIDSKGKVKFLNNRLDHYSYYSVEEYDRKLTQYSILRAKELHAKGLKPNVFHFWVKPWFRFVHHYILRLGVLDGGEGYIISKLHAHHVFKRYLFLSKMWENEKVKKSK